MVSASRRVPLLRLSMMRRFLSGVQRPSAMLSPARWTTASWPSREPSIVPASGSQRMSFGPLGERVRRVMLWPPRRSSSESVDPIRPVAPLIRTFICSSYASSHPGW
jgi:hypothetical protein